MKYTPTGTAVARFNMATNRSWKDDNGNPIERTDWHRIIAWRKSGEIAAEYLKKGSLVCVEGRLESRSWDDQNGQKRYITEVISENIIFLSSKGSGEQGGFPPLPEEPPSEQPEGPSNDAENTEDDLPF